MRPSLLSAFTYLALSLAACGPDAPPAVSRRSEPGEIHFVNIRQLTFGSENAEAYWSFAGDRIVFMSTRPPAKADQIYLMAPDGSGVARVSTGTGRTTCGFFMPGDRRVLFSSTHALGDEPPKPPDRSHGYAWGIFEYDIYTVGVDGTDLRPLVQSPGYDAEATVSPKGDRIVFTSSRDGDLDIYTMAIDGTDVRRLTTEVGYDGGPVFSPDGTKIAYRAGHPTTEEGKAEFKSWLSKGIVRPNRLEIMVMDADGSHPVSA